MNFYNQRMALRGSNFKQVANIENLLPNSWSPAVAHRLDLVNIFIDENNANNYRYNSTASSEFNERTYFNIEHYNNITIAENSGNISDVNSFLLGNNSNLTLLDAPTFTSASLTKIIFFGTMFVISLIGNVATVIQMRRLRRRKSTINTLIVNLAVADLLVTFFCTAGEAAWAVTVQWLAGDAMCKLVKYMQVFSLYLSTYITVAISLDRCVAILDPMRRNGASQRVRIMILFAWIFSALFSIPQLTLFNVLRGPFKEEFYQCVDFGPYRSAWQLKLYPVASLMFAFVLPLAVIGTAYGLIFTTISRKSKEHSVMDSFQMPSSKSWVTRMVSYKSYLCVALCNQSISSQESISSSCSRGPVRSHLLRKAKRKSLRMSFVIVLAFIVCWAPYYIFFFYVTFLGKVIDPMIFTCFSFIGLSNTMLNPIIYGAFQLCKVHFYNPSSWRRNAWRGTSPRLQSTNLHREHPFDYQAATPASSCCSVDSNKRLLAKPCHCEMCHYQVKDQMVHLHLQKKTCKHFDSGRCWNCTQKFTNRKLKDCLCLHSYLN